MSETQTISKELRRHRRYWRILRFITKPILSAVFGFSAQKVPALDAPVLVLANHNTDIDPVFVAQSFERQMYFVASEHIFRWGWITRAMNHMFAPLPIIKGRSDSQAAMAILRMLRKRKNICIFAEGNRSVDGITAPISPATGLLAKTGVDLVTYKLEGGYFTQPRWSRSIRKGRMRGYVVNHYTAATLKEMSLEEINKVIANDLYEDAYARQAIEPVVFRGKRLAEHLETALYLCPACLKAGRMHSHDDHLVCECGLDVRYTETGFLEGQDTPFDTIAKWYAWQLAQAGLLIDTAKDEVFFTDGDQKLYDIVPCTSADLIAQGPLSITRDAISVAEYTFPLEDIAAMAIVGQMTITFSTQAGKHYEIKSDYPRSGYKYVHAFEALRKENEPVENM